MEATILLSTLKKKFKGKVLMQGLVGFAFVHTIMNSLTFFFFKFLVSTIFLVHNNLSLKGSPLSNMPFIRYTSAPCQYNYLENKYLNFYFPFGASCCWGRLKQPHELGFLMDFETCGELTFFLVAVKSMNFMFSLCFKISKCRSWLSC